jgi:hypothetical protein
MTPSGHLDRKNGCRWMSTSASRRWRTSTGARSHLPNATVHAVIHVVVENQIALSDEIPVKRTMQRLMSEGLDRHDSIHAVGSVLIGHTKDLLAQPKAEAGADPNRSYYAALDRLAAKDWSSSG